MTFSLNNSKAPGLQTKSVMKGYDTVASMHRAATLVTEIILVWQRVTKVILKLGNGSLIYLPHHRTFRIQDEAYVLRDDFQISFRFDIGFDLYGVRL